MSGSLARVGTPHLFVAALAAMLLFYQGVANAGDLLSEVSLRARIVALTPKERVRIYWRAGGEGFGGNVMRGELTTLPADPAALRRLGKEDTDYSVTRREAGSAIWLEVGTWSPEVPLSTMDPKGRAPFVAFTADGMKSGAKSASVLRNVVFEFELRYKGRALKLIRENGPDGPTATLRIPFGRLATESTPSKAMLDETVGVDEYATQRLRFLEGLPWAHRPVPRRFGILTDCYGYGAGAGFLIRTTDKNVLLTELRSVRQLGVNGLRQTPPFVLDMLKKKEGIGAEFSRIRVQLGIGYSVPFWDFHKNLAAGCPYNPQMAGFSERIKAQAAAVFADPNRRAAAEELWLMEVDEIGSVFDYAPESKAHQGVCPYCRRAFHEYLRSFGLTLRDFDAKSWDDLRSTFGYWEKSYAEKQAEAAAAAKAPPNKPDGYQIETGATDRGPSPPVVPEPGAQVGPPPIVQKGKRAPLSEKGWALLYYYSKKFNADSTAMLFTPQRDYFAEQNEAKRRAIAAGLLDTPAARQPWVYAYASRGVNFLIAGHSLDPFDFYRLADTGFVYETSNRDPRAWEWDSYMCDIGRILSDRMGKRFGIAIKPHRGAVIQRALSAASRGAKLIIWYTYGPDWEKGDSFAESRRTLSNVSRAARLLAAAEDVIYDSAWAVPAQIAVVRPRTSEFFENNASWENGKWVYTALQHQHLPVDPLDEGLLESEDLSRYKVIYVSGSHLRRSAAAKLKAWVERGGILYTSGWGVARDEADQELSMLSPVLGLRSRNRMELWNDVWRYAATTLPQFRKVKDQPAYGTVTGRSPFSGSFPAAIGREVLEPAPGTEVLATWGDGKPAVTRHAFGKGAAYVVGFYPGVEYSSDVTATDYDMSKDFNAIKASFVAGPALAAGVHPVVEPSHPLVEGVLLKNTKTGKLAVSLMNWAYRTQVPDTSEFPPMIWQHVAIAPLTVKIEAVGPVRRITSAWTGQPVPFVQNGGGVTATLPKLDEGDVLLLE